MNHKHVSARLTIARALGTCSAFQLDECAYGALLIPGTDFWIETAVPVENRSLTLTQAADYLRISHRTMAHLLARGAVHGVKVPIPGHPYHKEAWTFTQVELDAFRFGPEVVTAHDSKSSRHGARRDVAHRPGSCLAKRPKDSQRATAAIAIGPQTAGLTPSLTQERIWG